MIPDLPVHKSAWYLSEEEREHAFVRMGRSRQSSWDLTVFRRVLLSWQFWLLPLIFMRESPPVDFRRAGGCARPDAVTNSTQELQVCTELTMISLV